MSHTQRHKGGRKSERWKAERRSRGKFAPKTKRYRQLRQQERDQEDDRSVEDYVEDTKER